MAESLKNEEKECIDCFINKYGFCNRKKVSEDIIKECQKLDIFKRTFFANENNFLIQKIEEIFAEVFWGLHNLDGLSLTLEMIKRIHDNPKSIFPDIDVIKVKDNLFIEILMKFCKMAEDLGALLCSKSENPYEFTMNYIKYQVKDVVRFYKHIQEDAEDLKRVFYYPPVDKQDNKKAKSSLRLSFIELKANLKIIAENYIKYKDMYNSYKHGYRIRFKDADMQFGEGNEAKYYSKVIVYYENKMIRKFPGATSLMCFEKFDDSNFMAVYELCITIIYIMRVFNHNYKEFHREGGIKSITLFFDPTFQTDDYLINIKKNLKNYTFKY